MRLVIALGGNALLKRGEPLSLEAQRNNMTAAAAVLAPILTRHQVVITHGNGPQVGWLARHQGEAVPLDMLDAETEGMLGYLIEQELRNVLPGRELVTLLSQVVVDAADPAFSSPTKPIGPVVGWDYAEQRMAEGEKFCADGEGFRRVVPSPAPRQLLGLDAVERMLDAGWPVICAGGGGIPVVARPGGGWRGVEAVVDKDATSALLARSLKADRLLLLTDVDAVYADWETERVRPYRNVEAGKLAAYRFADGSMGPKVAAACDFVLRTGRIAAIGSLDQAVSVLAGEAGTQILAQSSR